MTGHSNTIEQTQATMDDLSSLQMFGNDHEVTLVDVLTQLAYRKWLIAKVTGAAALISLVLCFVLPVRYTATTRIMPPQQTQSTAAMLMMSQLANAGGGSMAALAAGGLGLKNPNDIYVGLLTSRPIADAIIQKFNLAQEYHASDMTQARKKLAEFTDVTSEKNGFIAISVKDTDKKRVAEMANTYTDELRLLTKSLAVTEAAQRRLFYEDQLKQAKEALVGAALTFQHVQQQKGLVQLDAQAKVMIESRAALQAKAAAKQVEIQAMRSYSTEQNPEIQLAEKELASLEGQVSSMERQNRTPGIGGLGLESVPSAGLEYLRAEHELQYQQALYDMLMKQYDAARLDESKDAVIIQVVEPAIEPDRKTSPKRTMLVTLSTIVGLLAGCILALILWWRELMQFDPVATTQLAELRSAITGRKAARA
ncbi:MAG TPA: GNVR domain-containing protein [Terracidiphilus sp.]|nr:GNVR domain-containing protein [Terracidiphilus sp.]